MLPPCTSRTPGRCSSVMSSLAELQAYTAPQQAGYAGQLIAARMDVARFRKVNTAKGPWRLLDALATAPCIETASSAERGSSPSSGADVAVGITGFAAAGPAAAAGAEAVTAGSGMQLEEVRRIVRDVAADIVGEESLEGANLLIHACVPRAHH